MDFKEIALHIITTYKYPGIYLLFIIDTMGVFLPSKTLLTICGILIEKGQLSLLPLLASTLGGSLTGFCISYALGRKIGKPILTWLCRFFRITPYKYEKAEAWFNKYGPAFILVAYFTPGLRHITPYLAGITRMPFRKVILYASTGAALWILTFVSLGRLLGNYINFADLPDEYLPWAIAAVLLVAAVVYLLAKRCKKSTS